MNAFERGISFISPKLALSRAMYHEKVRSYEAATKGRRGKSFDKAQATGPNIEVGTALATLRNRSRWFVRNNGWAKRAIEVLTNNVVGEGIRPAPQGSRSQVKNIKKFWKLWAESTLCDFNEKMTFYGLQQLAAKSIFEAGEVIIIRRKCIPSVLNPFPIKLQILEPDQLADYKDGIFLDDGGYIRLGVEYNRDGVLRGYWIYEKHPTDGIAIVKSLVPIFIPKEDCLHIFEILRPGQVRGVPQGVSAFLKMSDFSDYEDAQLIRQKIASLYVAFISGEGTVSDDLFERLEPGIVRHTEPGETVTFGNPPPAEGYDAYTKKILQGIAAAYSITYESLTTDYSNVNFSSGRMAKIDVSGNIRNLQYNMLVPQLCVGVWNWFMDAVLMTGMSNTRIYCSATDWTAPRVQQLDPVKETNALILQIQAGLKTVSEVLREQGEDPDEHFEEMKTERKKLADMGLNLSSIQLANEPIEKTTDEEDNNSNQPNKQNKASQTLEGKKAKKQAVTAENDNPNETNTQSNKNDEEPLAVKFGVSGTTSIVDILTNEILSDSQKINTLEILFSIEPSDAKKMLSK